MNFTLPRYLYLDIFLGQVLMKVLIIQPVLDFPKFNECPTKFSGLPG